MIRSGSFSKDQMSRTKNTDSKTWWTREREKIAALDRKGKIQYIWNYYWLWIVGIGFFLVFGIWFVWRSTTAIRENWIGIAFPNAMTQAGNDSQLWKDYLEYTGYDTKKKNVLFEDKLYFEWIPDIYRRYSAAPVDEKKVILVENHPKDLSNTFQELYKDLMADGSYNVHIHHLGKGYIHREEHEKNVAKLVKDLGTAKYVFQSEANEAISALTLRPETKVIQLWHACGAFKKFGMSTAEKVFGNDRNTLERHPNYANLNLVSVSSPEVRWAYVEAMNLKKTPEIVKATGISRTDVFFDEAYRRSSAERVYQAFPAARGKKIILYAPTFRGHVKTAAAPRCKM